MILAVEGVMQRGASGGSRRTDRRRSQFLGRKPHTPIESLDGLLLTRRQRLPQAAGGPWAELLCMSGVALALAAIPDGNALALILHRFIVMNTLVLATNPTCRSGRATSRGTRGATTER